MALQAIGRQRPDDFTRLHRLFVEHFGIALALVWIAALVAALQAPWVANIRGLLDPFGRAESTSSFLFGLPVLMLAGWLSVVFGAGAMRRAQLLKDQRIEFAAAAIVAFTVFCMAIDRVATAFTLGSRIAGS